MYRTSTIKALLVLCLGMPTAASAGNEGKQQPNPFYNNGRAIRLDKKSGFFRPSGIRYPVFKRTIHLKPGQQMKLVLPEQSVGSTWDLGGTLKVVDSRRMSGGRSLVTVEAKPVSDSMAGKRIRNSITPMTSDRTRANFNTIIFYTTVSNSGSGKSHSPQTDRYDLRLYNAGRPIRLDQPSNLVHTKAGPAYKRDLVVTPDTLVTLLVPKPSAGVGWTIGSHQESGNKPVAIYKEKELKDGSKELTLRFKQNGMKDKVTRFALKLVPIRLDNSIIKDQSTHIGITGHVKPAAYQRNWMKRREGVPAAEQRKQIDEIAAMLGQ